MRPNYSAFTSLHALINWKLVQSTKKKAEKNRIFVSFFCKVCHMRIGPFLAQKNCSFLISYYVRNGKKKGYSF